MVGAFAKRQPTGLIIQLNGQEGLLLQHDAGEVEDVQILAFETSGDLIPGIPWMANPDKLTRHVPVR